MDRETNGLEHWQGLAKFDGVNWTVYNTSNSGLPWDYVWAIAIDEGGKQMDWNKWRDLQSLMVLIGLFITHQIQVCLLTGLCNSHR
jgi:hypothetical protein